MGTVYYDDFPTLEFQATSVSARECSEGLLKMLGCCSLDSCAWLPEVHQPCAPSVEAPPDL